MRLVVIGGVAAGLSAASAARRRDPSLEITVLEKGADVSYSACGLPYYIGGTARAEDLVVYTPQFFRKQRNITVLTKCPVREIHPPRREVLAGEGKRFPYDRLVIATGASSRRPQIPGIGLPHVLAANTLAEARAVEEFLACRKPRRAAILGAGYIGLEYAEALVRRGLEVQIFDARQEILGRSDPALISAVEEELAGHGVRWRPATPVTSIGPASIVTAAGEFPCELVIVAAGLRPNVELASEAGAAIGSTGAIRTDDRMQTSLAGVYAAGDCAETIHLVTGRPCWIPLGTTANKTGRVAGENAAGGLARFPGMVGTSAVKVFDQEIAMTGLDESAARSAGFSPLSAGIRAPSRAPYLGGGEVSVQLTADRNSGRLLGGLLFGRQGVAQRVDVVAAALHARMRVEELAGLDLAYAPPFAPVWDPILIAARQLLRLLH